MFEGSTNKEDLDQEPADFIQREPIFSQSCEGRKKPQVEDDYYRQEFAKGGGLVLIVSSLISADLACLSYHLLEHRQQTSKIRIEGSNGANPV